MRENAARGRELALSIFQTALPHCARLTFHMDYVLLAEVVVSDEHFRLETRESSRQLTLMPRNNTRYSLLRERSSFLISRLVRAASSEDDSSNCAHRLLSPSSFVCPRRYDACMIASSELLKS